MFVQTVSFHISISLHVIHHGLKLIDNILHNAINGNTASGNITTGISNHLVQFLITSYQVHSETKPRQKRQGLSNMICKILTENTP